MRLADVIVQRHRPLGQGNRLVVAPAQLGHGRLVHAGQRQHVFGAERRGQPLGVAQGRGGVVVAALLREHHPRDRVHLRQVPAIAGGVKRGGGLGEVLADDGVVADLQVAVDELEVGEADAARVVRRLGVLEGAAVQRDGARLLAAGRARRGRAAATAWPAAPSESGRESDRAGGPSTVAARSGSPCMRQASASAARTMSSSWRLMPRDWRRGSRSSAAADPRPRSSSADARASTGWRGALITVRSIRQRFPRPPGCRRRLIACNLVP